LAAISAKKLKIPTFHMEAGNRCFDERVPEEINRKIIDHISDINIVLTEHARNNLIREGLGQNKIFNVSSHMPEVINFYKVNINACSILKTLKLIKNKYFLISYHREENLDSDKRLRDFLNALTAIDKRYSMPILISAHPRVMRKLNSVKLSKNVILHKPFSFFEYIKLQQNSYCVISDSGTITEESSILGFPAITIRDAHERPEGMDSGVLIMSELTPRILISNIETTKKLSKNKKSINLNSLIDKDRELVSVKILKIVNSYISFINRETWKTDVAIKPKKT
jgi:UDP-N-acetylglucosamine 2-epimerase (non-hydrolysing)